MAMQDPYMKKPKGPFSADDEAAASSAAVPPAAVPASPAAAIIMPARQPSPASAIGSPSAPNAVAKPETFQGVRQLTALGASLHTKPLGEITAATPQSEIAARAANTRWNYSQLGGPGDGAAWAGSSDGDRARHGVPGGFTRPQSGPDSLAAVLSRPTGPAANGAPVGASGGAAGAVATPQPPVPAPMTGVKGNVTSMPAAGNANRGVVPDNGSPQAAGVDVTGFDGTATPRHLTVGAMVNGVPTFSDGTGASGIPRTMTAEQIKGYGNNVSRADAGALSHVLASDVSGAPVSTDQQVAQLVRGAAVPITGSRPTAEQFADADRNAIAMRDPRSAAGTAAHNLAMEAQYGRGAGRKVAAEQLAQLAAGSNQSALAQQQADAQQQGIAAQGKNALDVMGLRNAGEIQNTALQAKTRLPERGTQVLLDDGTIGLQSPITGQITRSTFADGTVAKGAGGKLDAQTARSNAITDSLGKYTNQLLQEYNKNQALLPPDQRKPAPIQDFREQAARAAGVPVVKNKQGVAMINVGGKWVSL